MKRYLLLLLTIIIYPTLTRADYKTDSLIKVLKSEISLKNRYDKQMENKLSSLRKDYQNAKRISSDETYNAALQLFETFKDYRFDSTYHYAQELIRISQNLHDSKKLAENKLRLGTTLITAGMFKETFDCLRETDQRLLDRTSKKSYYLLYSWAYSDLANYNADRVYAPDNLKQKYRFLDSAIALTQAGSFERAILEAQRQPGRGPHPSMYFLKLLKTKLSLHEEAMVLTGLSFYRSGEVKIQLLTQAAINDVRTATYRALAMVELGNALSARGDVEDGYFFLTHALQGAYQFGSRLQIYQVTDKLSKVAAARDRLRNEEKQRFLIYLVCISGFALSACSIGFIIFVQLKKVKTAEQTIRITNRVLAGKNKQLWEDGRIKEEYIGYFFTEHSRYIGKLDKLKRISQRKLKSGRLDELQRLLEQIDITSERSEFFITFDRIFLKLFPDFIEAINSMFKVEDHIVPKTSDCLNTQLRIFALMRLGINKNETIGAILQYTVNTVYTYRFRAKAKALVPGDHFEQRIMGIQLAETTLK